MRSSVVATARAALLGAVVTGCSGGNFSNADLEYMGALPERSDVLATIPGQGAGGPAGQAELYVATRKAVNDLNGLVDMLLGMIDAVRSRAPDGRLLNERIWGPSAADMRPGWDVRLVVDHHPEATNDQPSFTYHLDFRRADALLKPGTAWMPLLVGSYLPSGGVRKGRGTLDVATQALRDAGFDAGVGQLLELHIVYDVRQFPISVTADFTSLAVEGHPETPTEGHYAYQAQSTGQGQLDYDIWDLAASGNGAVDKFAVTSEWLGTGEGRAVVHGPGGLTQTQCWDRKFAAAYNDNPWAPDENISGDISKLCPAIPTL